MLDPKLLRFSDDSPKENPWQDDRLGFQPFARRVSEMLLNLEAPNGFVIGLHGSWGSGKSTALNFIKAYIRKHNEELEDRSAELTIIDFRPWMVSGHQDLVAAFFKVLSEALDNREGKTPKRGKGALRTVRAGLDPIIDTVAKIGMAAHHTGGATSAVVVGAAAVGKKSLGAAIDRWLEEPSIQSAYDKLTDQLATKERRFLIVVDDIDRLDNDEIRSIMQMVKTVGRLPNVIYLLAYDQRIVRSALDKHRAETGDQPGFAEKIIQQEFELPRAGKDALLRTLEDETRFLLDAIETGSHSRQILASGLHRWMRHPRDVTRLANALKFVWPTIQGEIDAVDVLAMEGLRLFEPSLFGWVQGNRDFLFGAGRYVLPHDEAKDDARRVLNALFSEEQRSEQLDLLCALFPSRAKDLRGDKRSHSEEDYGSLVRRRGVGHEPGYDTYFQMYPTDDAVSKVKIDDAMSHLEDRALQAAYLAEFMDQKTSTGEPLITEYLDEIYHRLRGANAPTPTTQLLQALFKVGDAMAAFGWTGGFLSFPPQAHLTLLVREMLRLWGEETAGLKLIEAAQARISLSYTCTTYVARAEELGQLASEQKDLRPLISADDLAAIGAVLLTELRSAAEQSDLSEAINVLDVYRAWAHISDTNEPAAWVRGQVFDDPHFLCRVVRNFLGYSVSDNRRHYTFHQGPYTKLFELDILLEAAERHAGSTVLNDDETAVLQALSVGMHRIRQNESL